MKLLIEAGADMNLKRSDGGTALMAATRQNYLTVASELVTWGADTTIKDNRGNTPLEHAQYNNFNDIALDLLHFTSTQNTERKQQHHLISSL